MADNESDQNALVAQFCGITGAAPQEAQQFLISSEWDLEDAAATFYASHEGDADAEGGVAAPAEYTGPRTLDGRPAPDSRLPSVASSSRPARQAPRTGIATLGSLGGGGGGAHAGHDDDSDDSDYRDDEEPRDLYAGGEKSALAVQDPPRRNDPRKLVEDIVKKARSQAQRAGEPTPAPPSRFHGAGMTLGNDETPSTVIADPTAIAPSSPSGPPQRRELHIWSDGFSVEDGPLHRYDDPQNAGDLAAIRAGRAPIHLMNVRYDQPVDVVLNKHDENYVKPKAVYKPFSGGGHRLGAPVPGSPSPAQAAAPAVGLGQAAPQSEMPQVEIDASQPTLSLRIQLADGTRLPARFNTSHTIGDVYGFIERANPASSSRPWVVATTFPNKEHTDKTAVLGEMQEFRRGGTAVQKWA